MVKKAHIFLLSLLLILSCSVPALATTVTTNPTLTNGQAFMLIHRVIVKNPSSTTAHNITIELPIMENNDVSWQKSLGEDFSPAPSEFKRDKEGRRIAVYHIDSLAAKESLVLEQSSNVLNYASSFLVNTQQAVSKQTSNLTKSASLKPYFNPQVEVSNYPQITAVSSVEQKYLTAEQGIESDSVSIKKYAQEIAGNLTNPYEIARRIFADINLYMQYDNEQTEHGAAVALRRGSGNCVDYTCLYVACLRSLGIPARTQEGYLYSTTQNKIPNINSEGLIEASSMRHVIVEFYIEGVGWVLADPTFTYGLQVDGKSQKMVDWSRFAGSSPKQRFLRTEEGHNMVNQIKYTANGNIDVNFKSFISLSVSLLPFDDLADHWAKDSVLSLYYQPIPLVNGQSKGYFGVNQNMTRAELVALINRVLIGEPYNPGPTPNAFNDVSSSFWGYNDITEAVARGYVNGFPDGTFRPNQTVTRGELAAILDSIGSLPKGYTSNFTDLNQEGWGWAKESIESLAAAGLADGISPSIFAPQKTLTRGEAAVFIDRYLKYESIN